MNYFASTYSMNPLAWSIILLMLAGIAAFEIWMFVSVILNKQISGTAKVLWAGGMILLHPFVAIFYYFSDYQKTLK